MSQSVPPFSQDFVTAVPARPPATGLAIGALICGIASFCVPGLGIVAVILGIIAFTQASANPQTNGGKGMAIAGIVTGALSLLTVPVLMLGILLPALGKARQVAREVVVQTQIRAIDQTLLAYAVSNKDTFPEPGADWQARLKAAGLDASLLVSPRAEPRSATDSFVYVPGFNLKEIKDPTKALLVYENPKYVLHGRVSFGYADGHVDLVPVADVQRVLNAAEKPGGGMGGR